MPITYQQEPLFKVEPDITELAYLDWEEMYHDKGSYPFDPDWDLYYLLEESGSLLIFTARDSGKLIGYFSVMIGPSLHSKGKLVVSNDIIYLHKDYRKGLTGVKLFKFTEACLAESGYKQLQVTTSEKNNIDSLLKRLDYEKIETKFEKRLG